MKLHKETNSSENLHGRWYGDACGAAFALELIGERWALLVVRELMLGARRFSQLRAQLPGISAKILTERLGKLEQAGVLIRRTLPAPASAQVYELTEWGRKTESIMQELGRWAVQSSAHNPMLPLTPVAFMLSLRTMFDPQAAHGIDMTIAFDLGQDRFLAHLHDGMLDVERTDEVPPADVVFRAASATPCLPIFYGKQPLDSAGPDLVVEGDRAQAERFIALFRLPPKIA